jgi:hypothetical protein
MTPIQMLALAAVAVAVALTYIPLKAIKLPVSGKPKPPVLKQIEAVVAVREAYTDAAIISACNTLLQALLQVKP